MGKFVRSIKIDLPFEEETATFRVRPMSQAQLFGMRSKEGQSEDDGFDSMLKDFITCIDEFSGLHDAAGAAITKEDVISLAYFAKLLADAAAVWVKESTPGN